MSDKLSSRRQNILAILGSSEWLSVSDIAQKLNTQTSMATLRRELVAMVQQQLVQKQGYKKATRYSLAPTGLLFRVFQLSTYYAQEETARGARETYNFELFPILATARIFTADELDRLNTATKTFRSNARGMDAAIHQKELERFVIEFAWKSSKIEGNTYTLLDTEFLLKNGTFAEGKSKHDATMIINHKNAYLFAAESTQDAVPIDTAYVERIHYLLTQGLGVRRGVRDKLVGISGSLYQPLAVRQQLKEQLSVLLGTVSQLESVYAQALVAVLGLSYLQPFEDGNKRTARVLANSLLLRGNTAPLSYRSVNEREYKEACLVFYEQNSLVAFKQLFIDQYIYSATHYNIAQSSFS